MGLPRRGIGKYIVQAALLAAIGLSLPAAAVAADSPPLGKLPDDARPLAYALMLKIDPREARFSGQVRIRVRLSKPAKHVWLHARELHVERVRVTDSTGTRPQAQFAIRDPAGVAEVTFDERLPAGEIELTLDYDAPFSPQQFQGLYKARVGNDVYVITQMEAVSARFVFPGFDEPRFKTPYEVTLTVPADQLAFANTVQTSQTASADGKWKTLTFAKTRPLPTYLIAMAVGPWDVAEAPPLPANAARHAGVPLRAIGPRGTAPQLQWILEQTPGIVRFYEDYTAQPYPFDKLDLLGSSGFLGAMENAGLIIFEDVLLRLDRNSSAGIYRGSFNVTAHEVAHQWFGDLVTVPWWDDIWLNEAFATWAQQKETSALKPEYLGGPSRVESTLGAMREDSLLSARKIRQPIKDQGDIQNAFDSITYEKGAAVLRMFEEWLGEDVYRDAMRDYLGRHAFGSGSSEDLIGTIARVSGKGTPLRAAMRSFLDQPGIPLVRTKLECKGGRGELRLSQMRYLPYGVTGGDHAMQWNVPVCMRLGSGGKSSKQCFLLDRPRRDFVLEGGCADWYLPNADGAGYYRFTMADEDFANLRARVPELTPVEQMMFADAVSSSFRRGDMTPGALLEAMPVMAGSDLPQVATALFDDFAWIHRFLADDARRGSLEATAIKMYQASMAALGYAGKQGESDGATRLRARLVDFLAFTVRDRAVLSVLNAQGRAGLGLDTGGRAQLDRLDPNLREAILKAAVQESGVPAFDAVLHEFESSHQAEQRRDLITALASTHDAVLGERALNYGLTPAVAIEELTPLLWIYASEPENGDAFWRWFQAHYSTLMTRLPPQVHGYLPVIAGSGRCGEAAANELANWFAPHIKEMVGGDRALAQSLENIRQCGALRAHFEHAELAHQ